VPAVIYGAGEPATPIHVEEKLLVRQLSTGHFMNSVVEISVGDAKAIRTLPRDVQFHPVTDRPLHVDFQRVAPGARIRVRVPVHFENEDTCPGLKAGANRRRAGEDVARGTVALGDAAAAGAADGW
jgi:large subunit ribosomal protein L25